MTQNKPLGIGNDILDIDRVRLNLEKHRARFLAKLFTAKEQAYCLKYRDPAPHFAGKFSAKEAVAKALGTGIGKQIGWLDIEILHKPSGQPYVCLSDRAKKRFPGVEILLSISHCKLYVVSTASVHTVS